MWATHIWPRFQDAHQCPSCNSLGLKIRSKEAVNFTVRERRMQRENSRDENLIDAVRQTFRTSPSRATIW